MMMALLRSKRRAPDESGARAAKIHRGGVSRGFWDSGPPMSVPSAFYPSHTWDGLGRGRVGAVSASALPPVAVDRRATSLEHQARGVHHAVDRRLGLVIRHRDH